jgi:pimeloyl-ACP methyl ester carboxylesterase
MSGEQKRLARVLVICALGVLPLVNVSCKLDDLLFHGKSLSSYSLPTGVVPASSRELVPLASNGRTIYGIFVTSATARRDRTILYCHGNRESIEQYWDRVELLYKSGYAVFIFDYEGFGMSEGECSEQAMYADGRAALSYVRSRQDVDPDNIIYYGYSLGCAVAVELAANARQPRVLVCEAPFASGNALVQSGTLLDVPGSIALKGDYNNADNIRRVHAPVLVLHGTDDRFIDLTNNGQVVFDNANPPKQFIPVTGAGHTTIPYTMGVDVYLKALEDFIATYDP